MRLILVALALVAMTAGAAAEKLVIAISKQRQMMACPSGVKKIECGMGASSHSFEKCSASMRNGRYFPPGVS